MSVHESGDVFLVPESDSTEEKVRKVGLFHEKGVVSEGCELVSFDEWTARGRLADCDCKLIECVCAQARLHRGGCSFRLALTCAIPIECEKHGFDVCPECDPCTCEKTP